MLDIRRIRDDAAEVKRALTRRGPGHAERVEKLEVLDELRRAKVTEVNALKAHRNEVSKEIGALKRAGEDADDLIEAMRKVGDDIGILDNDISDIERESEALLLSIPNTPFDDVPEGGEACNRIVSEWGTPRAFDFEPRPHWGIGETLGILDLERGARVSGSGFTVLRGAGARLQRTLIDLFLDRNGEAGYEEVRVPYLVRPQAMTGTGQLPKFSDESYYVDGDDLWLIPTAEVPVTNLYAGELLQGDRLPLRFTAYSPCFRREAGAAGKDTRGLLRVHQFDKVELVHYERPERSLEGLEALTRQAESLLELLGLPYRRVVLATGDLGHSAAMTYDLEVWAPGVGTWLEVSSCTTFTDYQARRAGLRFRPGPGEKPEFVHTLNGSALALPRVVAAILETYQDEDGSVRLPAAVAERMGREALTPSDG